MDSLHRIFNEALLAHQKTVELLPALLDPLAVLGSTVIQQLQNGHKLLVFGNGGSAGDAQHIAAELTGRFVQERRGLPAIALTTDTSALTSIANDFGFEHVFARQIEALARPGDVALGISTSGNSANVIQGLRRARQLGCEVFGFSGRDGGQMNALLESHNLVVPSPITARVQECHILLGHILCEMVDTAFAGEGA